MAATLTPGFGLSKPATTDDYDVAVQNGNMDIIESKAVRKTTAALTYYVNTATGNDSNDGLTSGTAFKTYSKARSIVPDVVNHAVQIIVADGTYAEQITAIGLSGKGSFTVTGNVTTPGNVIVQSFHAYGNSLQAIKFEGMKPNTNTGWNTLSVIHATHAWFDKCLFDGLSQTCDGVVNFGGAFIKVSNCVFNNCRYYAAVWNDIATKNTGGTIAIGSCSGTGNLNGLNAFGGIIQKVNTTLPTSTNGDTQSAGGFISDSNAPMIRNNSGTLEMYVGGSWTPVGIKAAKASANVKHTQVSTYSVLGSSDLKLVGRFTPDFSGTVRVVIVLNTSNASGTAWFHKAFPNYANITSFAPGAATLKALIDTPLGTILTGLSTGNFSTILSTANTSDTTLTVDIEVMAGVPTLFGIGNSGAYTTTVKSISIGYDIVTAPTMG